MWLPLHGEHQFVLEDLLTSPVSLTAAPESLWPLLPPHALDLGRAPPEGSCVYPSLLGQNAPISVERIQWICQTLTPGEANSGGAGPALAFSSSQTFHPHSTPGRVGTGDRLPLTAPQPLGRRKLFCLRPPAQHTYSH